MNTLQNEQLLKEKLLQLGIFLDISTGHLYYESHFTPLHLNVELIFVRHGETYGNCGQITQHGKIDNNLVNANISKMDHRVFQGSVDEEINHLTIKGKHQAHQVALMIEKNYLAKGWVPDIIYYSPLSRAQQTALPLIERHHLWSKFQAHDQIREMSFGAWDNRRICDFKTEDKCHQFYQSQHALIKQSGINGNGKFQVAECFCEVLLRAHTVLEDLNTSQLGKKIILFSHSMFGAACCILLGKGKKVENQSYLAFDGKQSNGQPYTIPHTTPILLSQ